MKHGLLAILAGLLAAGPVFAGVAPRPCSEADYADLPYTGMVEPGDATGVRPDLLKKMLMAEFTRPTLKYAYDTQVSFGFFLRLVVGLDGRVMCVSPMSMKDDTVPAMNSQRQALLESVGDWHFKPFIERGEPTPVTTLVMISEEELPRESVAMPSGDPALMSLSLMSHSGLSPSRSYHIELHGDGTAMYASDDPDDSMGPQSYNVDPATVRDLLRAAKTNDFWSLRDLYRGEADSDANDLQRIDLTVGGKTKSVTAFTFSSAGTPDALDDLMWQAGKVARVDMWRTPTLETVSQLKRNGFDFTSSSGGRLLQALTRNPRVKDEVLFAIMANGAPLDPFWRNRTGKEAETLLESALGSGRSEMAKRLIASGALTYDGEVSAIKVDRAFQQAVSSCDLASVDLIAPFHPPMTYPDPANPSVRVSIMLAFLNNCEDADIAVAQRLFDMGAKINDPLSDGSTLLQNVWFDAEFARFLLDHGADINVVRDEGYTALGEAYDQDLALLLLERGADPRLGNTPLMLRRHIKHSRWREVKAWLQSHGFSDVLVPEPGEN